MTKKDYIKLADAMDGADPLVNDGPAMDTWKRIYNNLFAILAEDNPRFDGERFFKACTKSRVRS
jgi:hypothetical protein